VGVESSFSISPPPGQTRWNRFSDTEKAEALADNLEAQFQTVTDLSLPAVIETVDVALRSYFLSPAREPQLTTPDEVHEATSVSRSATLRPRTVYRTRH